MSKFIEATLLQNFGAWRVVTVRSGPLNEAIERCWDAVFPQGTSGGEIE